jgi:hypothetical protein
MLPDIAFNTLNVGRGGEIRTPDPLLPNLALLFFQSPLHQP